MIKNKFKFGFLVISTLSFIFFVNQVLAQQMLLQVVGGGYRLDGPNQIMFTPVVSSTIATPSEISIRTITSGGYREPPGASEDGFIGIEDYNGGSPFELHVQVTDTEHGLINDTYPTLYEIPLSNFYVKNNSGTGEAITTINGRTDGISLAAQTDNYIDLTQERILVSGTGQQPGIWKIYPGFKIEIPSSTPSGTYTTSITFTII